MKSAALALLLAAVPLLAQHPPPPPAAPRDPKLPQAVEKTLDNGLRVIVVPKHDLPLVAARLMVRSGGADDPRDRAGLAELTATVLTKGTKTKTAQQIAHGVEALGATLASRALWDATAVDLSVMSSNLPAAMEFVGDVVRNATFQSAELERERAQTIDALSVNLQEPRILAGAVASRLIFGDSPYGNMLSGTPASLGKIKRQDLVSFHRRHYSPQNSVLVLAGDVKPDTAFALAQNVFGTWKGVFAETSTAVTPRESTASRILVIDMPDAGQSSVVVGRQGIRRTDPAFMRALVANSVLGGGYSSRLNQEIRIKRGLSYGAGSSFDPRVDVGPFTARTETKHESAAEVVGIMVGEMSKLSAADVPETELVPRKASLIGNFAQSLETTLGLVNAVSSLALHNLPPGEINRHISGIQAVTAEQVRTFAASNIGKDLNIVVIGDAKQFLEPLRKQFEDVEVIAVRELDLDSPTLRVRKKKS